VKIDLNLAKQEEMVGEIPLKMNHLGHPYAPAHNDENFHEEGRAHALA
jgi:hypothetical protein